MDSQLPPLDRSTLAHALPVSPSPAEQDKVVASLASLPPELKLKIVEEIWEDLKSVLEAAFRYGLDSLDLQRCRKMRMRELSLVDKQFHELAAMFMWRNVGLYDAPLFSLHFFLFNVCRQHGARIRTLSIRRHKAQRKLLIAPVSTSSPNQGGTLPSVHRKRTMAWAERNSIFDRAEELEKRMTGSTTRYKSENRKDRYEFRWDVEGVFLSFILRTCCALQELYVDGAGPNQRTFSPPPLLSLRSLTLHFGTDEVQTILAFLHESPHLQQLSLIWRVPRDPPNPPRTTVDDVLGSLNRQQRLRSLRLLQFPPAFFEGPPRLELSLEYFETLLHLRIYATVDYAEPPPNEPLLPHLVSLDPPQLWRALGFAEPVRREDEA